MYELPHPHTCKNYSTSSIHQLGKMNKNKTASTVSASTCSERPIKLKDYYTVFGSRAWYTSRLNVLNDHTDYSMPWAVKTNKSQVRCTKLDRGLQPQASHGRLLSTVFRKHKITDIPDTQFQQIHERTVIEIFTMALPLHNNVAILHWKYQLRLQFNRNRINNPDPIL